MVVITSSTSFVLLCYVQWYNGAQPTTDGRPTCAVIQNLLVFSASSCFHFCSSDLKFTIFPFFCLYYAITES